VLAGEAKSRKIIEIQNKEINQSLDYAKLIVDSTMNMNAEIKKFFPDLFVLFSPKYKVGGDFYFFYPVVESKNIEPTKFYLGVFDCTGHGIPGAILSMLGISSLNEIVKENINQSPDVILNKLNTQFIKTLRQGADTHSVQDGMEGCLCLIDTEKMTLEMASAKRNLYLIEAKNPLEINEIKGSKMPIGGSHFELERNFGLVTINLNDQDKLILCSDGIVDQFSGDKLKSKKYSNKRLKEIFTQSESLNFMQLCAHFSEDFSHWRGNIEQTDDATLIALSVTKFKGLALKVA
jgi:serine phosphatase RsbU (regulator of sigma subunit)